jgi:hypothetical protein
LPDDDPQLFAMRCLSDDELHILRVVAKHERICISVPVNPDWAPIASKLRQLVKWKYLVEESTGNGPAYRLTAEAGE